MVNPNRYLTTGRSAFYLTSFVGSALLRRISESSNNHNHEWLAIAASSVSAVVVAALGSLCVHWTRRYLMLHGRDGRLGYVRDGKPCPSRIRRLGRVLDDVSCACDQANAQLVVLQQALSRARSVVHHLARNSSRCNPGCNKLSMEPDAVRTLWELLASVPDLGTHLANISHNLDLTAALLDKVPAMRAVDGPGGDQIRCRKNSLSNRLMFLWTQTHALINLFQQKQGGPRHDHNEAKYPTSVTFVFQPSSKILP